MAQEKLFHVGVKALLTNSEGKLLVLRTVPLAGVKPHWDIPGGRIQQGDTAETTLSRELREETGLSQINHYVLLTSVISSMQIPVSKIGVVGLVLLVYSVQTATNQGIKLSMEHAAYDWVSFSEAANLLSYKYPEQFTTWLLDYGAAGV